MSRLSIALFTFIFFSPSFSSELPAVVRYDINVRFDLKERRVNVAATLTIRNISDKPQAELPFILYRLLSVEAVTDSAGRAFSFSQKIAPFKDEPSLQANAITVQLPTPLLPNDSMRATLRYSGFIFGYPEVMAYVQDRIDEEYSLLRPDAFAFPALALPSFSSTLAASRTKFSYTVAATVPPGYTAACGGALVDSTSSADSSIFVYRSKLATWRIDLAVAPFEVIRSATDNITVFSLPADSAGAMSVLGASRDAVRFYTGNFGVPALYNGYTVIEIPDGWGSQASDYYFLQTAAAFKDTSKVSEVYHEIGHTWNAAPSAEIQRCRYFDEAFASYFAALALREFRGDSSFTAEMEKSRISFVRRTQNDPQGFDTPIAGYGAKELGRFSYTKGAWSLYVLNRIVGDTTFNKIVRTMLTEFRGKSIDFAAYEAHCEKVAKRDLHKYFQEWIYGTKSSQILSDNTPIGEIVKRYR